MFVHLSMAQIIRFLFLSFLSFYITTFFLCTFFKIMKLLKIWEFKCGLRLLLSLKIHSWMGPHSRILYSLDFIPILLQFPRMPPPLVVEVTIVLSSHMSRCWTWGHTAEADWERPVRGLWVGRTIWAERGDPQGLAAPETTGGFVFGPALHTT